MHQTCQTKGKTFAASPIIVIILSIQSEMGYKGEPRMTGNEDKVKDRIGRNGEEKREEFGISLEERRRNELKK